MPGPMVDPPGSPAAEVSLRLADQPARDCDLE
jgi:hypothetical protein